MYTLCQRRENQTTEYFRELKQSAHMYGVTPTQLDIIVLINHD